MSHRTLWSLPLTGLAALALLWGCGEDGTRGAEAAIACVESDLIAQCPPGSDPILGAEARTSCSGSANLDLLQENGAISGQCVGEGECQVLCQFKVPCLHGVERISKDELVCSDGRNQAACGDGVCEGTEDAENCPRDCGAVCDPGRSRCSGGHLEECNLQGQWELTECAEDETCRRDEAGEAHCERR